MPRSAKKTGGRLSWQNSLRDTQADVTLNDFANSSANVKRLKKPTANAVIREVKQLRGSADDNLSWYEKDLEDFDIDTTEQNSDPVWERNEETAGSNVVPTTGGGTRNRKARRRGKKVQTEAAEDGGGINYPLDVWYMLSEYIRPEDVVTFACICKSSLAVVTSVKFWLTLYKRYYKGNAGMPERLQPECMERHRSLRACVIRSLYYTYPPFVERLRPNSAFDDRPHRLVSSRCILMWHRKVKNYWNFYFKFRAEGYNPQLPVGYNPQLPVMKHRLQDLLQMLDDVDANSEERCQILQVSCQNFVSAPVVMGMFLANVTFNVSHEMHHYRLRLVFDSARYHSRKPASVNMVLVNLEPVATIRVMDWWHPQYPHYTE